MNRNAKKQAEYWESRAIRIIEASEKTREEMSADLAKLYEETAKAIQKEIEAFYGKYARDVGVTLEETHKALNKSELKSYLEQTQAYYDAIEKTGYAFDPAYRQKLHRQLSLKSAVSRLEALQADCQFQVEKLYAQEQEAFRKGMGAVYEESYLRTVFDNQQFFGLAGSFDALNTKMIDSAVKTKWLGDNYSIRIWENKDRLTLNLEKIIPQGMILGKSPRIIGKEIADVMQTSKYNGVRLARTEFNKISGDGRMKGYVAAGIEEYEVDAVLDHKTSEICEEMDGKIFLVSEYEPGITANPFHPNCRTNTKPHMPKDEIDRLYPKAVRLATDENGKIHEVPADISFSKWRAGLKPLDGGKVRYVA